MEARADGRLAVCCLSKQTLPKPDGTGDFYLYKDSLEEAYNSPQLKQLRQNLKNGIKDKNCETCWREESHGMQSKRQRDNIANPWAIEQIKSGTYSQNQPQFLDLKLGSFCNLKCRICSPGSSTKWVEEFVALYPGDYIPRANDELKALPEAESRSLAMNWPEANPAVWQTLEKWLPGLKGFEFFGGEPFLNLRHLELLKKSVADGLASNQKLHYNTNGTVYPEFAAKNLFPHFKQVSIFFSIDGLNEQFEYQRFGAKWEKVLANFLRLQNETDAKLGIGMSVSILNIFYLPEFIEFWAAKGVPIFLNPVYEPEHFDIRALPPELKENVLQKLRSFNLSRYESSLISDYEGLLTMMMSVDNSANWPNFLLSTHRHDHYRQERFAKTFPEFHQLFTQTKNWAELQSQPAMVI